RLGERAIPLSSVLPRRNTNGRSPIYLYPLHISAQPLLSCLWPRPRRLVINVPHPLLPSIVWTWWPCHHQLRLQILLHVSIGKKNIASSPMNIPQRILSSR